MDARAWDERYAAEELVWSVEPNRFVAAECAGLVPGRALDLAAGEGRNAIWLARRGWEVTAVDFSSVAIEKGRRLAGDLGIERRVDWRVGDVVTGRGAGDLEGRYDLCVVAYLQLREDQRRAAARRGFGALAPGGTFLWVAHDSSNLAEGTGGPQDPAVLMSADDVLADLADQQLDVVSAGRVARTVGDGHRGEPGATAYDCLVRLVRR